MPAQDSQTPSAVHSGSADPSAGSTAGEGGTGQTAWWWPHDPRRTALSGVAAFLLGYVLTGVAFGIQMQSVRGGGSSSGGLVSSVINQAVGVGGRQVVASSGGELALALRSIGWTFFSAQQIPLFGTATGLGVSASGRVDVLTLAGRAVEIPLTPVVYYLIPPVCLVGAGWWLARTQRVREPRVGAVAGAQIIVGYLPAIVAATVLLGFSATVNAVVASATITADPVFSRALLFGMGYPLVFGACGGVLAAKIRT